ncbi:hypothetical protein RhiirB3_439231 [Rhizophagus irregularis]|nr:hypothetical protein RhiirB3_439231 [Rhizophagus irregularis]
MIDEFIRHSTQLNANNNTNKRGAFSSIYRWKDQLETWTKELKYGPLMFQLSIMKMGIYIRILSLDESMGFLCWGDIVDMLWAISAGLNFIHERDLIHGH